MRSELSTLVGTKTTKKNVCELFFHVARLPPPSTKWTGILVYWPNEVTWKNACFFCSCSSSMSPPVNKHYVFELNIQTVLRVIVTQWQLAAQSPGCAASGGHYYGLQSIPGQLVRDEKPENLHILLYSVIHITNLSASPTSHAARHSIYMHIHACMYLYMRVCGVRYIPSSRLHLRSGSVGQMRVQPAAR